MRRKPCDTRCGVHAAGRVPRKQSANTATCTVSDKLFTPRHESWRARRRYAAKIDELTARNEKLAAANTNLTAANTNLETTISALSAENSKLAAQCGAVVDATSEALLPEGTAGTHARALSSLCEQSASTQST